MRVLWLQIQISDFPQAAPIDFLDSGYAKALPCFIVSFVGNSVFRIVCFGYPQVAYLL